MDKQAGAQETSVPEDDEISLVDLLATLLRYKKLIATITLGAMVAVLLFAVGSLVLPPQTSYLPNLYTPKASILINASDSGGMSGALAASGLGSLAAMAGVSVGGSSNGQLAVAIATSNTTIDELNGEFNFTSRYKVKKNVKAETRLAVRKHYSAAFDEKTGILSISFEDIDPEYAMAVVNRAVEILDRRFMALSGNKASEQKRVLEAKLADVQAQMNVIQGRIQDFTGRYGVLSVEALATEQVTVLGRLRAELIMKDMEIESYQKFSTIDDPVIRRLKTERESINNAIRSLESGSGGVMPGQKDIPALAFEFAQLQRDLLVQGEIFKLLTQQYELAKLNAEGQEPAFQVLEPAEAPDKKSGPSRGMLCVVVTMAAFFMAVLAAFVLEAIKKIHNDPQAMAKLKGQA